MSAIDDKIDDLTARIGNSEQHYCGKCRCTREHRWKRTAKTEGNWRYYWFDLMCSHCGNEDTILNYRV